ncbi:RTF2 RING-finger protein [Wolffia australiana]
MELAKKFQVIVRCSDIGIPSRALPIDPSLTFNNLKQYLLSLTPPRETLEPESFYFSSGGRTMLDSSSLSEARILPLSTLTLHVRVCGGGGDGGATGAESRDCYLNMYAEKKPDKVDPNEKRMSKWTTCALSFEPLAPPCVADRLGNVFNKERLVEALLGKKLPKEFSHIRGLKDMMPIVLSEIPGEAKNFEKRFQCPITGVEFNGKCGFVLLRGCGHVLSTKAFKEVKSSSCLVCHRSFSDSEKMVLNGSAEEVKILRERMEEERGKLRERKEKKDKKSDVRLSGTKHLPEEKARLHENGKHEGTQKKFKAIDIAPAHATKEVYASIFTSSRKSEFKETYSCRSLPLGRN